MKALRDYRVILKQFPFSREAKLGLARNLAKLGYCEEAADVLVAITESTEGRSQGKEWLGVCYLQTGESEKAIPELTEAIQLKPRDKELRIYLARAYATGGHVQQAIDSLKALLAGNGHNVDALYWIGKFYDELSEETFQRMVEEDPSSYSVLQIIGEQYVKKKEYPKALDTYRKALSVKPEAPGLNFDVGDVYWRMRKFDKAKEELEKELKLNPYHPLANYELGDIYVKDGDPIRANPYLERALSVDPSLAAAHRSLGNALFLEKEYSRAIKEFRVVAEQSPSDITIHALLAQTYRRMGHSKEANEENEIYERLERASMDSAAKSASERLQLSQHALSNPAPPSSNH